MPASPDDLFKVFKANDIEYNLYSHEPLFTVSQSSQLKQDIPGLHCRNLFLRDKKKNMFLVVAPNERAIDLKKLSRLLDCGRLSFGSEDRLWQYLGVKPGSVCPFAIMNDKDTDVTLVLDKAMMQASIVNYHPLDNSMTVGVSPEDLRKFCSLYSDDTLIVDLKLAGPQD